LNIPMEVTVTIAFLDSVTLMVREFGATEILKSAAAIVTLSVTWTHFSIGGLDGSRTVIFSG